MTQQETDTPNRTIEPCHHMETWVNGLADGSLKGLARTYTRIHVAGCVKCREALGAIEKLRVKLHVVSTSESSTSTTTLDSDRRDALNAALDRVDTENTFNVAE